MPDREYIRAYIAGYEKLLDQLKIARLAKPEIYNDLLENTEDYRNWVVSLTGIETLRPLPEKI
ncbi:hypothetical protein AGMMS49975_24470 [Clostridia bacterium]|nr:hypothetical protein AGMMS49975_24470 [Clostridia bacterium]